MTGKSKNSAKKNKSTAMLLINLQSLIALAVNIDKIVLLSSLIKTSAFDAMDINLLLKTLKVMRLSSDVIGLV
jgi:hypothetical protein